MNPQCFPTEGQHVPMVLQGHLSFLPMTLAWEPGGYSYMNGEQ